MRKGIGTGAFPYGMSLKDIFKQAKEFGFEGVELWLGLDGEVTPDMTPEKIEEIKKDAKDAGIELYSLASGLGWSFSLVSDNKEERELAKTYVKKQLELAAALGCDTILVVPGHTGVDFAPALGVVPYDVAYARSLEAMRELAPYAEKAGVYLGVENVWNKFLLSPLEMKGFIDEVGSPYIQSYFDVGNVLVNSYPEHWINILGSRIKKVHFKDFKRSIGNLDAFCDILAGDVDYKAVMAAFKNIGYDNWVTAEVGPYSSDNTVQLKHTSAAMDYILSL